MGANWSFPLPFARVDLNTRTLNMEYDGTNSAKHKIFLFSFRELALSIILKFKPCCHTKNQHGGTRLSCIRAKNSVVVEGPIYLEITLTHPEEQVVISTIGDLFGCISLRFRRLLCFCVVDVIRTHFSRLMIWFSVSLSVLLSQLSYVYSEVMSALQCMLSD